MFEQSLWTIRHIGKPPLVILYSSMDDDVYNVVTRFFFSTPNTSKECIGVG